MARDRYLIVMAGGSGTRMGASVPKQFLTLQDKTILQMTIERFADTLESLKVVVVLPEEYIPVWKDICYGSNFSLPQTIVAGGLTRFHSVRNGLEHVPENAVVAIHDGVRPFVSAGMISGLFDMSDLYPAVVPVMPSTDTLRPLVAGKEEGILVRSDDPPVDRSRVFSVQTPQLFHSEIIKEAYRQAYDTSFTDDASVAERAGVCVRYIEGEKLNIKLTTPEDIRLARAIMSL